MSHDNDNNKNLDNSDKDRVTELTKDELIRRYAEQLLDQKPKKNIWEHPLTLLIIGFILTGVIGQGIAYKYNENQKKLENLRAQQQRITDHKLEDQRRETERRWIDSQKSLEQERANKSKYLEFQRYQYQNKLDHERSFVDEINKQRVPKIAEVWNKVYAYENTVIKCEEQRDILSDKLSILVKHRDVTQAKLIYEQNKEAMKTASIERQRIMEHLKTTIVNYTSAHNVIYKRRNTKLLDDDIARYISNEQQSNNSVSEYNNAGNSMQEKSQRAHKLVEDTMEAKSNNDKSARELKALLVSYRYWLGDKLYDRVDKYIMATNDYVNCISNIKNTLPVAEDNLSIGKDEEMRRKAYIKTDRDFNNQIKAICDSIEIERISLRDDVIRTRKAIYDE
jgi:hypothetical protein